MVTDIKASTKNKIHTVYKTKAGERVPSVTTILGILNKPALIDWAWNLGTQGIDYKAVRDNAGDIGTLAHHLILCDIKGEKPDTSEYSPADVDKAETCLLKYWDWRKANHIEPVLVEHGLVSVEHRFGGTIDCLARCGNELWLIDHKTGKAIYSEMFYQLAAYAQLLKENGHQISNARILRIGRDETGDFEERVTANLDREWQVFLHCMGIYRLQAELRKER